MTRQGQHGLHAGPAQDLISDTALVAITTDEISVAAGSVYQIHVRWPMTMPFPVPFNGKTAVLLLRVSHSPPRK